MIVSLSGENSFGLHTELARLTQQFVDQFGDMALEHLRGDEASIERIQEAFFGLPFLTARKLIILREASTNKQFVERASRLIEDLPATTDVVLVEPKLDKRSSYYKLLKKSTDFRDFPGLDETRLGHWLVDLARSKAGSLSLNDARFLVERVGLSQQLLVTELEKLLLYDPDVTRVTIELLSEPNSQSTVFELLEAVFAGNAIRTFELYKDQREQRVEPSQIIAMLAWQLRVVGLMKTASGRSVEVVAKEAKINPYVLHKSHTLAARLSLIRLKQLVADLLIIDMRSKREGIDLDEALQDYLLLLTTG